MECAQVTEEQRLWTETQIQKAKHNAWPSCLASVYLTVTSDFSFTASVRRAARRPLLSSGRCCVRLALPVATEKHGVIYRPSC